MNNFRRVHAEPKYQSDNGQYVPIEDVLRMKQRIEELESQLATVEKNRDNWEQRCSQALADRDKMEQRLNIVLDLLEGRRNEI